jgi:predicted nucleic acid-binding Zn ribbon protein
MFEDYKCIECEHITEYKKPYGEDFPTEVKCEKCGKTSKRVFGKAKIIIPEHMRAHGSY